VIGSASSGFSDLVTIGEMVELGLKNGKIPNAQSGQTVARKFPTSFPKKKEEETNAVMTDPRNSYRPLANAYHPSTLQVPYQGQYYVAAAAPMQYQQPAPQRPQYQPARPNHWSQISGQNQHRPPYNQRPSRIDPIPIPYSQLWPLLIKNSLVEPRNVRPLEPPYPHWYNPNAKCEFHSGAVGHSIEDCRALKEKVQELIDNKSLSFKEKGPDVKNNPLPGYNGPNINAIEESADFDEIKRIEDVKTPLLMVHAKLVKFGLIEGTHDNCEECALSPKGCQMVKKQVQELMNQGILQISRARKMEDVLVIEPHFESNKGVSKPVEIIYKKGDTQPFMN
jgi:hypothetical protein